MINDMTELETYKKALQKISQYGIKPTGETELQRIKRLKSIADKALFIADVVGRGEQSGDTDYCNSCHKHVHKGFCNSFNCRWSKA